jgi:hypothetical protein
MTHLERLLRKRNRAIRLLESRLQEPDASASLFSVYRNLLRDQETAVRAHLTDEAEKPIDWAAFMAAHPVPQDNPPPAPFPSLLDPPLETPSPSFSPGKIFGFLLPILLCLSASLFPASIRAQLTFPFASVDPLQPNSLTQNGQNCLKLASFPNGLFSADSHSKIPTDALSNPPLFSGYSDLLAQNLLDLQEIPPYPRNNETRWISLDRKGVASCAATGVVCSFPDCSSA